LGIVQTRETNWVILQELMKFWDELLELPEDEERAILCPSRTASNSVTIFTEKNMTGFSGPLSGQRVCGEAFYGRVGDPIQKTKVCEVMNIYVAVWMVKLLTLVALLVIGPCGTLKRIYFSNAGT
jgi:hypothetical protein